MRLGRLAAVTATLSALVPASVEDVRAAGVDALLFDAVKESEGADEIYRGADLDGLDVGGGSFVVVPIPVLNPTLGAGAALTGLYTFAASANPDTPRSTLGLVGAYTDKESWLVAGGGQTFLDGDRYRVGLTGGYGNLNLEFFGVGNVPFLAENPIDFTARGGFLSGTGQARVFDPLFLGVNARYLDARISTRLPISVLPELRVPFTLTGLGPQVEYDTRKGTWWPTDGLRGRAELLFYDQALGSDRDFTTSDSDLSYYHGVTNDVVLTGNARLATASDAAPFFMKPFVSLRGFPAGRFLDDVVAEAQAELRWTVFGPVGVVGFAGFGNAAEDFGSLGKARTAFGAGAGLRYRVSEIDGMNIGIDYAIGDGESAFYFRIGEAF